jgi:hypothetical protein
MIKGPLRVTLIPKQQKKIVPICFFITIHCLPNEIIMMVTNNSAVSVETTPV